MHDAPAGGTRERLGAAVSRVASALAREDGDVIDAVGRLSRTRRVFAPLALTVGALAMLLEGARLLASNWRLMLVEILPAVWVWLAMLDLRLHVLRGRSFHAIEGAALIPVWGIVIALTILSFHLNAVFAYAISGDGEPDIGAAFRRARQRPLPVVLWGGLAGALLALATTVAPRWGRPWFTLTLGPVVGLLMVAYVALPARMIGVTPRASRRDKLTASLLSSALGVTVSVPPYVLGRAGILMLGSPVLLVPGIVCLLVGLALQAGATGAVRAIKLGGALRGPAAGPRG